jgi:hypothetical protein
MLDNIIEGDITFQGEIEASFLALKEKYIPVSCIFNTRTLNRITGSDYYVSFKLSVMLPVTGRDKLLTAAASNGVWVTLVVSFYDAVFTSL